MQQGYGTIQFQREMGKRNVKESYTEMFGQNIKESVRICRLHTEDVKWIPNRMHYIEYKNRHGDKTKPRTGKIEWSLIIKLLLGT